MDQIFHDICLQGLPVVILEDRSGLAGEDGQAHQGIYDLGFNLLGGSIQRCEYESGY